MTTEELAWLAGLWEGEGSFFLYIEKANHNRRVPNAVIAMSDQDVIEKVASLIGGNINIIQGKTIRQDGSLILPSYRCRLRGWNAVELMQALYPWMGSRRRAKIDEIIANWQPTRSQSKTWTTEKVAYPL